MVALISRGGGPVMDNMALGERLQGRSMER